MLKTRVCVLFTCLALLATESSIGQADGTVNTTLPSGVTVKLGVGRYSVTDEYFSQEKYSGTMPYFSVTWSRLGDEGGYRLGIEHRNSSDIRSGTLSSGVTQFSLSLDFLHRAADFSLFSKDASLYLGPSTGLFLHFGELNIAYAALEIPYSFAILLPLGVNTSCVWSIADRLLMSGSLRASVLSLGLRMFDLYQDEHEESPLRFLTMLSGTSARVGIGLNYSMHRRLSLEAGYELQLLRIKPWDPLVSASDNVVFGLTVGI